MYQFQVIRVYWVRLELDFCTVGKECVGKLEPVNLGGGTVMDVNGLDFTLEEVPARFEGGTQNIAGVIGLGAAVDYVNKIGIGRIEITAEN